jgi:hypothetical protein
MAGLSKSFELGVMAVAFGCSEKDLLGEQSLAPEGYKSYAVQQRRMKRPKPHRNILSGKQRLDVMRAVIEYL